MDKAITVTVPVQLVGTPVGVKVQGGVVEFLTHAIEVECLPTDIPEHVTIDISELGLHESVRVRDLPVDAKWTPASEAETMLVHIVMPKVEEVKTDDAAVAAAAEPEVAKKGKTDKEDEPAAKDKK